MKQNRKSVTEKDILSRLQKGAVLLPPLTFRRAETSTGKREAGIDALLELGWKDRVYRFAAGCRSLSTPKVFEEVVQRVRRTARPPLLPLIVVPYLSEAQLGELEREEVSGIDLSGNGIVIVPGELLVSRSGQPNRFPQSFPIKNVYRGASSLVSRVFLVRPEFGAVGEIQAEVRRRQGSVALSTVSKVLRRLEDDLIVGRQSGTIRLLQEDKLLEKLVANYSPPEITGRFVGKCALAPQKLFEKLRAWADKSKEAWVGTGTYSLQMYPSVPRDEKVSLYCTNVGGVREFLGTSVQETDRFPTLEVLETQDDTVYFDPRTTAGSCRMASPLQTYLELMAGDKRDRETAERLRPLLLGALRSDPL